MINEKIKNHLIEYNKSNGWGTDDETLIETLLDSHVIAEEELTEHRWWIEYTHVVEIDGMIIGFDIAKTTGDMSAREAGWEFDPDTIVELEKYTETVTKFRVKRV